GAQRREVLGVEPADILLRPLRGEVVEDLSYDARPGFVVRSSAAPPAGASPLGQLRCDEQAATVDDDDLVLTRDDGKRFDGTIDERGHPRIALELGGHSRTSV